VKTVALARGRPELSVLEFERVAVAFFFPDFLQRAVEALPVERRRGQHRQHGQQSGRDQGGHFRLEHALVSLRPRNAE
jgi:hypothetical protein